MGEPKPHRNPGVRNGLLRRSKLRPLIFPVMAIGVVFVGIHGADPLPAQVPWDSPPSGEVARALRFFYSQPLGRPAGITGCDPADGRPCFGQDHEDQLCRVPGGCRSESEVSEFLTSLVRALGKDRTAGNLAQTVYALTRFGEFLKAAEVLGECGVHDWWCEFLFGMVLYHSGQTLRAEEHLRSGLHDADRDLACRLESVEMLMQSSDVELYRELGCDGREEIHSLFWWLSDPLHSSPGNERWVEHIIRRFELILHEKLLEAWGQTHPDSHEWNVVRRGFEDSWSILPPPYHRWTSKGAAANSFVPKSPISGTLESISYDLDAAQSDEGFTSKHGAFSSMSTQVVRFWDGDSIEVVAATDGPVGEPSKGAPYMLSAILTQGPLDSPIVLGPAFRQETVVFRATVDNVRWLLSLEGALGNQIARRRLGIGPLRGGPLRLSDLLLFRTGASTLPQGRSGAVSKMLGGVSPNRAEVLGIYLETAEPNAGTRLEISVKFESGERGLVPRILGMLGAAGEGEGTSTITWSETSEARPHGIVLTLDIRAIEPGRYTLVVEVKTPNGRSETQTRPVEIR